jgi:hypothetical protein
VANDLIPVAEAEGRLTKAVHVRINASALDEDLLERLAHLFGDRPGKCDVYLHCVTPGQADVVIHATGACRVAATADLRIEVERILGEDALWFTGGNGLPRHSDEE